jgi:hypothetical protein
MNRLRPLEHWDRGFESHSRHGCLCAFILFVGGGLTGDWRKLNNEELHNLYSSSNIIGMIKSRRMRCARHVARMRELRNAHTILVGNPEGKRPLVRPRRRWVDNIKIDLREIGQDGMNWIDLAQDREQWRVLVNTVMNLQVP